MKKLLAVSCLAMALVACGGEKSLKLNKEKVEQKDKTYKLEYNLIKLEGKVSEELKKEVENINEAFKLKANALIEASKTMATEDNPIEFTSEAEIFESKAFGTKSIVFENEELLPKSNGEKITMIVNIDEKNGTIYNFSKVLSDEKKAYVVNSINDAIKAKQNFDGSEIDVFGDIFVENFDDIQWYFNDDFAVAHFAPMVIGPHSAGDIEFSFSSAQLLK